jgi:ribosomal protein L1
MPNIPQMGQVWGPAGNALSVIMETEDSDIAAALQQAVNEIRATEVSSPSKVSIVRPGDRVSWPHGQASATSARP